MSHSYTPSSSSSSYRRAFGGPVYQTPPMSRAGLLGGSGNRVSSRVFEVSKSSTSSPGVSGYKASTYSMPNLSVGYTQSYGGIGETLDFSLADALNQEFLQRRTNEKVELQHLNDRFANYIEKVCMLEQQNQGLVVEVEKLRGREPTHISDLYEDEVKELRREIKVVTNQRSRGEVERENLADDLQKLKMR
ncbi:desmin b [Misgurnus anguillicaudatus]|uniref:desmin b n=1 Tax=Misgurnus anguillicaudatus TaxID=75329 RepID=UPI003CCFC91D